MLARSFLAAWLGTVALAIFAVVLPNSASAQVAVGDPPLDWDRAEREVEGLLAREPDDPRHHFQRGRIRYLKSVQPGADAKAFDAAYAATKQDFQQAYDLQRKHGPARGEKEEKRGLV